MSYPYSNTETLADGLLHAAGLIAVYAGVKYLMAHDASPAVIVYAILAGFAFVASAVYHMTPWDRMRPVLRRIDHAAIYLKIAGTYTPLALMLGSGFSYAVLVIVWVISVLGALAKLTIWGASGRGSLAVYLGLGWVSVLLACPIALQLGTFVFGCIATGGVLYTLGCLVFARPSFRFQNPIWHGFVLSASACCFMAVAATQSQSIQISPYTSLDMPEPVTTQMLAPVPACDNNQMIVQPLTLQHAQNNHPCATFTIVAFDSRTL